MPHIETRTLPGATLSRGGRDITPLARVTRLTWPGGELAWHRPVAVEVCANGQTRRIPIRDVTRLVQLASLAACLVFAAATAAYWASRANTTRRTAP
jgi:hypothetical protein